MTHKLFDGICDSTTSYVDMRKAFCNADVGLLRSETWLSTVSLLTFWTPHVLCSSAGPPLASVPPAASALAAMFLFAAAARPNAHRS